MYATGPITKKGNGYATSQLNNIVLRAQLVVPMNRSFLNLRLQWTHIQLQWTQKILQQLLHKEGQLRQNMEGMPK